MQQSARHHRDGATAGFQCAAMRRRIDPSSQAADDRQARAGQRSGEPFGLADAVPRRMPCPHNSHGQRISGLQFTGDEEHARWIVDLAEIAWVRGGLQRDDINLLSSADFQFFLEVDRFGGRCDASGEIGSDTGDLPQLAGRGFEHVTGGSKVIDEFPSQLWSNARNQRQAEGRRKWVIERGSGIDRRI